MIRCPVCHKPIPYGQLRALIVLKYDMVVCSQKRGKQVCGAGLSYKSGKVVRYEVREKM